MDATSFTWWLHGYSEITNGAYPTPVQWQIIQDHLNTVFVKVTPDRHPVAITGCYFSSAGVSPICCVPSRDTSFAPLIGSHSSLC